MGGQMGNPLRIQGEEAIYFVTNRCFQEQFLLRPDDEVNRIAVAVLLRAARIHKVEIFAFVFMSNHFHLMVRARSLNLHEFMKDFQSNLAICRETLRIWWK